MTRLTAALTALSAVALTGCDIGCYFPYTEPAEDIRLEEGRWSFALDEVSAHGSCDIEDIGVEEVELRGSVFYTSQRALEIEVEGFLLSGFQEGREIFAEGFESTAVDYTTDEHSEPGSGEDERDYSEEIGVYLDGFVDSPAQLRGALVIEQLLPGQPCVIEARYIGWFDGDMSGEVPAEEPYIGTDDEDAPERG